MTQVSVEQALQLAVREHQAGSFAQAEAIYRQVLGLQPENFDALRLLGVLANQVGQHDLAVDLLRRAIAVRPDAPLAYGSLGTALLARQDPNAAIIAYQQAIRLAPEYAEAHCNLGSALSQLRRFEESLESCRRAIELKPDFANAHNNLGLALEGLDKIDEAAVTFRRAIELKPSFAEAHNNLGNVLTRQGRTDDAIAAFRAAIRVNPAFAKAYNNLANSLRKRGELDQAIALLRQAIERSPDYAEAYSNLSAALKDRVRTEEALTAARRAIELKPDLAGAHHNLGFVLDYLKDFDAAIEEFRRALRLDPALAETHNCLGNALQATGRVEDAIACYQRAASLAPELPHIAQNIIFALHFAPDTDRARIHQATRDWNERFARPLAHTIRPHANVRDPDRRLKIGYVSPDLRVLHPVARFLMPLLELHDKRQVQSFGYSVARQKAADLDPIRALSDEWRDVSALSDERAAEQIREDGIDILVDLAMHSGTSRLLIFARKPAPVQATWLAYPGTTGLDTMDYRITDPYLDPPGLDDEIYREKSIRLPHCWYCFRPPVATPQVNALPALASGTITFGCLNTFSKVNVAVLSCWARVLESTPQSRLLLHAPQGSARETVRKAFAQAGVSPERVSFVSYLPMAEYFSMYQQIDVALDPFPFGGGTTSCDTLWMGVPLVTLRGTIAAGRASAMQLQNLQLPELIAHCVDDYVRIATELARDLPRLGALRKTLRERMTASPLMDAPGFARDMEAAYRQMWRKWCAALYHGFPTRAL